MCGLDGDVSQNESRSVSSSRACTIYFFQIFRNPIARPTFPTNASTKSCIPVFASAAARLPPPLLSSSRSAIRRAVSISRGHGNGRTVMDESDPDSKRRLKRVCFSPMYTPLCPGLTDIVFTTHLLLTEYTLFYFIHRNKFCVVFLKITCETSGGGAVGKKLLVE